MRAGVILPSFRDTGDEAVAAAKDAEALGVDGVFCYDHLWPMGQPHRPALAPFPLLAVLAAETERVHLGTCMARVGLVPNDVLVAEFATIDALAPGRLIAGVGTGDHLSQAENEAYGIPFDPPAERRGALGALAGALGARAIPVWVGGATAETVAVARAHGAAVNLWDVGPEPVATHARGGEVTWAGPVPADRPLGKVVPALAAAGAMWAVFAWPVDLGELAGLAKETQGRR